jgi:ABC-2 type transport system permease protein
VRKVWAVIRREFVERARTKAMWISAILGPVFFAALIFLPMLMAGGGRKDIAVVDATTTDFGARAAAALQGSDFTVQRVPAGAGVVDSLTVEVSEGQLDGFVLLSDELVEAGTAEYRASNVSSFTTIERLERTLQQIAVRTRLEREGVDPAVVGRAQLRVDLATKKISRGRTTDESAGQSFSLAYFMGIILYVAITLYGVNVMNSVLEEKTTRIVEVLVSSLRPGQLMTGKLIGVGAVSLVQFLIWGVSGRAMLSQRARVASWFGRSPEMSIFEVPDVTAATGAVFLVYFLGGFFLYSSMFAAVGAISSNEQEARQGQVPVTLLLLVAFMGMFSMLNDPGSTFAVTLSMIPFTSPIAMPVRWAAGSLALPELMISVGLLLGGIVVVTWLAARIYRVGILMTGKRPSPRELLRWVRARA